MRVKPFGRCSKGEICHNNNSLGIIGNIVSIIPLGIGDKFYPQFCSNPSKHPKVYKFEKEDEVDEDDELFKPEVTAKKENKQISFEEY